MAHQVQASLKPSVQTTPYLPLLQPELDITIVSQSHNNDSTVKQGSSTNPKGHDEHREEDEASSHSSNEGDAVSAQAVDAKGDQHPRRSSKVFGVVSEDCARERLKKHRVDVAGRVWIPDIWGQEEFLKDWIDCTAFDDSLFPNGIVSARNALVEEGRRGTSGRLRIEYSC